MPTFEFQATNASGESVRGLEHGTSMDQVVMSLQRRGLVVTQLGLAGTSETIRPPVTTAVAENPAEQSEASTYQIPNPNYTPPADKRSYMATSVWGPMVGKVALKDLLFFFRRTATMLEAGVPFVQTLTTISGQSQSPKLKGIVREMRSDVESGRPISFAMQRYPEVFSSVMLSMVRAGEEGGFLDRALSDVADYLERDIQLRNLYRRITFFPKLQVVASIIIIVGANLIISSINASAQKLSSPLTTPSTWIWLTPLIVAIFLFLRVGLANPGVRYAWDTLISNLPFVGKIMKELAMARFGRAFGAMYRGGVPMTRAMQISADACGNEFLRSRMYPAVRTLETGAGITETLRSTQAFSPIVLDMVQTGETTGNLDQMLNKMSEFYEDEVQTKSTQLAYVVGVLLGLAVAVYIAFIVINFYTGYFSGIQSAAGE
jgi:type IV pilus assembly protein PilC/MSHA biogenesis protein MshG